jgi:hypothetical protein
MVASESVTPPTTKQALNEQNAIPSGMRLEGPIYGANKNGLTILSDSSAIRSRLVQGGRDGEA